MKTPHPVCKTNLTVSSAALPVKVIASIFVQLEIFLRTSQTDSQTARA